jgi:predicted transcriptional regulator
MHQDIDVVTHSGKSIGAMHNTFQLLCSKLTSEIQIRFAKTVWAFGKNIDASLGLLHEKDVENPCDIITLRKKQASKIVGGQEATIILTSNNLCLIITS